MSDIYELMDAVVLSKDLLLSGQKMIEFADASVQKSNRATLVKHFNQRLWAWALTGYAFDNFMNKNPNRYYICEESMAVGVYLAMAIPAETTPIKFLNAIRTFGEYILSNYTKPIGKAISKQSVISIMDYLDEQYHFSEKVFSRQKAAFVLMPCSHRMYNSECLVIGTETDVIQHLFLYHMRSRERSAPNPEAVFFHELGHALYVRYYGTIEKVPDNIIDSLQQLCFPGIKNLSTSDQCEVFTDVLSVGLMYQTPFEKYDFFSAMHPDDKAVFKKISETLLDRL